MSAVPNLPDVTPSSNGTTASYGSATNGTSSSFKLHDTPIENFRPIKVIVIGAGYSGIYCGIRIPERIRNVDLVIYEKNDGVGGTWWENRYLGCACDVPSHSYQFSFEPNRDWSSLYAPAPEIQKYLEGVAKKYSADRFIKLAHEVTECRWDDDCARWYVEVKNLKTGEVLRDWCDVLVSARGNLNNPAWPDIEGLERFGGEVMHSARWNESYDFSNKRIAVIGSGSSAIQIVPQLQRLPGTHISTFVRSKTWISPSFGQQLWDKYGFEGFQIPSELQQKFHSDPEYYHNFRLAVEEDGNGIHGVTIKGTGIQKGAKEMFEQHMKQRLDGFPHIYDALLPSFAPGCRRLTPGPGYLEALTQTNVSFITSPIVSISESAVHTSDGKAHEIDTLICATGFQSSRPPPFEIIGQNGITLKGKWEKRATTYLSHSLSSFPNLFTLLGPNSAIGSGSLTMMIESVGDYVVKCIRKIQKDNIASMVVIPEREQDFTEYVDGYFEGTVFVDECRSWYRNGGTGEVVGLWPGSTLHCLESMRSPRWEDFVYTVLGEYEDVEAGEGEANANVDGNGRAESPVGENAAKALNGEKKMVGKRRKRRDWGRANRLTWLGNGWSTNQLEEKHLAWYLYPEFQDPPTAPRPEDKVKEGIRPFSY